MIPRWRSLRSFVFAPLALVGAAALLAIGFSLQPLGHALAVPFSLGDDLTGGGPGGSVWTTGSDTYACNSDLDGSTIDDAELDPDSATEVGSQSDAFDDALQLVIDGSAFDDSDDSGDLVEDGTGQALTLGPEEMTVGEVGTLNVTLEWKALAEVAKLRSLFTLHNPGESDVTATLSWDSNVGSDGDTGVRGSSTGDTDFTTDDRWVVTSDDPDTPGDPVNTFVLAGPGSPAVTPTSVEIVDDDCVIAGYEITVPAGETRYLLFFNQMSQTNEDALADAAEQFDTNPAAGSDLLSGLSEEVLLGVLNWNFQPATPTATATPAPTSTATATATPAPAALPPSGGEGSGGSGQPWLAIALGAVALLSGGVLVTARVRQRR